MVKIREIVKIDDRGRIVIPGSTRKVMKIGPGTNLLMIADDSKNEIMLTPFLGQDAKPVKMQIIMRDQQGALAKIAQIIGDLGINLLSEEAHILKKGEQAEWMVIADLATMKSIRTLEQIKQEILESGVVDDVVLEMY
nr:hypothetical protein [Candidatus Sigynarchaeota archaeon]